MLPQEDRMQAVGGEQRAWMCGAEITDARPTGSIHGRYHQLQDAGVLRALQYLCTIGVEIAIVEMDVAVCKHGCDVSLGVRLV